MRVVRVTPDLDIGPQSVVVVTPMSNLEGRSYWIVTNDERDAFAIRLSARIKQPVQFSWLVVQSDALEPVGEETVAPAEDATAEEEASAEDG